MMERTVPASQPQRLSSSASNSFPVLKDKSAEELRGLLMDKNLYSAFLHSTDQVRQLDTLRDDLRKGNIDLARHNLGKEGEIAELRNQEHVNLVDENLQKRIYEGRLDARELDRLAVVAMAGLAAEGLRFDKVTGQSADLFSLQRLINRAKPPLSNNDQQNITRWAVLYAGSLLKNNAKAYEALMEAMKRKAPVSDCVEAIEQAAV